MKKIRKRTPGTGSISYQGAGRRKPYCARVHVGDGKYSVIGCYATRKEAAAALDLYNAQQMTGLAPPPGSLGVTLGDCWRAWSARELDGAGNSKKMNYTAPWNRRLAAVADRPIRSFGVDDWQAIVDDDVAAGLSSGSVDKLIVTIKTLNKYAMERDYIIKDYSQFVRPPVKSTVHEKGSFTHAQIATLSASASTGDFAAMTTIFLIYTGFRIEEALSLTNDSVDRSGDHWIITGGLKTDAGRDRIVPVSSKLRPIVQALIDRGSPALISKSNGQRYSSVKYRAIFKGAAVSVGSPLATPHWARYTFATLCHEAGIDVLTQKWLMGHSTEKDITHHYTKKTIEQLVGAVEKLWWPSGA